jgi:hypothetical protein
VLGFGALNVWIGWWVGGGLVRYNEWQTDPLSLSDACRGISARCDLNPPWAANTLNPYSAFGAIDSKITSDALSGARATIAVSGPTWDSQPPFAWTKQWQWQPHYVRRTHLHRHLHLPLRCQHAIALGPC